MLFFIHTFESCPGVGLAAWNSQTSSYKLQLVLLSHRHPKAPATKSTFKWKTSHTLISAWIHDRNCFNGATRGVHTLTSRGPRLPRPPSATAGFKVLMNPRVSLSSDRCVTVLDWNLKTQRLVNRSIYHWNKDVHTCRVQSFIFNTEIFREQSWTWTIDSFYLVDEDGRQQQEGEESAAAFTVCKVSWNSSSVVFPKESSKHLCDTETPEKQKKRLRVFTGLGLDR